jgi:hypothetical protein
MHEIEQRLTLTPRLLLSLRVVVEQTHRWRGRRIGRGLLRSRRNLLTVLHLETI